MSTVFRVTWGSDALSGRPALRLAGTYSSLRRSENVPPSHSSAVPFSTFIVQSGKQKLKSVQTQRKELNNTEG